MKKVKRTQYRVIDAHSGTSAQEIAKAKRIYRNKVKTGEFPKLHEVEIQLSDVNNRIVAHYYCPGYGGNIGKAVISG